MRRKKLNKNQVLVTKFGILVGIYFLLGFFTFSVSSIPINWMYGLFGGLIVVMFTMTFTILFICWTNKKALEKFVRE